MDVSTELTALYRAEFPYVWNVLYRLGARGAEREDMAQEAFVAAFRQWPGFDRARPVKPWLFGICYRLVRDFKRRHQNRFEQKRLDANARAPGVSAEETVVLRERLALAALALEQLELDRRAVFVMHDIDGHSMPVIAEELGVPLNTAYSRLRLARRDFNAFVAAQRAKTGTTDE
ncbi:MAG: sigma-70 family RNA polymerase sigma factor [Myxococcaceae bacterium]|nr:sigma-70 family RNA polymerase sigma factor [Myxococcaceae bacterium]